MYAVLSNVDERVGYKYYHSSKKAEDFLKTEVQNSEIGLEYVWVGYSPYAVVHQAVA